MGQVGILGDREQAFRKLRPCKHSKDQRWWPSDNHHARWAHETLAHKLRPLTRVVRIAARRTGGNSPFVARQHAGKGQRHLQLHGRPVLIRLPELRWLHMRAPM